MSKEIVECIPNFSEGRRKDVAQAIFDTVKKTSDINVLDASFDPDHNRLVITFIGEPQQIREAAFNSAQKAVELIDIRKHEGVHPYIGVVDVIPFVPLQGVTILDCIELAREVGTDIWEKLKIPVYFYGQGAKKIERVDLAMVRRGGYGALESEINFPERKPDIGEAKLHPTAGAVAIGVRQALIAFNVNLATDDLERTKMIAKEIREKHEGLPGVKALGVELVSRKMTQVTMNITDYEKTSLKQAMDFIRLRAKEYEIPVAGSELIGLIPKAATFPGMKEYLRLKNFDDSKILENHL